MRRAIFWAFLLLLASLLLGATVFRDQVAAATGSAPVTEQNIDGNGYIRVHEQGTANVSGTFGISSSANTVSLSAADRGELDTANVHLASIDAQTAKLNFDGDGNLKTASQGTQTVHVDNASVQTTSPAANFEWSQHIDLDAGDGAVYGFPKHVEASLVVVGNADDSVTLAFRSNLLGTMLFLRGGGDDGSDSYQLPLSQPIPVDYVQVHCDNFVESCKLFFTLVGSTSS